MNLMRCFVLIGFLGLAQAVPGEELLEQVISSHRERLDAAGAARQLDLVRLRQSYKGALEQLLERARAAGNLDLFMATEAEIKRIDPVPTEPDSPSNFPELARLQAILSQQLDKVEADHAARVLQVYRTTEAQIAPLIQQLVRDGDLEGAKALDQHRRGLQNEEAYRQALGQRAETAPEPPTPPAAGGRRLGSLQEAQRYFRGRVSSFNPVNQEIEVTYDFSNPDQLRDFNAKMLEQFAVEQGRLRVNVPRSTDWWAHTAMNSPRLVAGFIEPGSGTLTVEILEAACAGENFHIAAGISDLGRRTLAAGPLGTVRSVAIEGWTPRVAEFRDRNSMLALVFPVRVTVIRQSPEQVEFQLQAGRRTARAQLATVPEMSSFGLFPKAWGGESATCVMDNLVIRGTLRAEWIAERTAP